MKLTKKQIIWLCVLVFIIAVLIALYFIGRANGWFTIFENADSLRAYVSSFGIWAPLIFFTLQFLQVIVSPIPGSVTTLVGGLLFGFIPGFLISLVAVFLGSVLAFLLGKLFGRPLAERIAGKETVQKYMESVSSRQKIVLILMFLLPFFPDDLLCLIAGLSAMRLPYFTVIVLLTRPWGLLFSALVGSGFISMPIWGWVIIGFFVAVLLILSIKYAPQIEERTKSWLEKRFAKDKLN